jgi:hypothetical protein
MFRPQLFLKEACPDSALKQASGPDQISFFVRV